MEIWWEFITAGVPPWLVLVSLILVVSAFLVGIFGTEDTIVLLFKWTGALVVLMFVSWALGGALFDITGRFFVTASCSILAAFVVGGFVGALLGIEK